MRTILDRGLVSAVWIGLVLLLGWLGFGCTPSAEPESTLKLNLYQKWQLQPGDSIHGFSVIAGLGDISISLNGRSVYAPFDGYTQKDPRNCLMFSSPNVPAYMFRLCGLSDLRVGPCNEGDALGKGSLLHFATLRKQPNGTWAIVEPSKPIIERILTKS